MIRLLTVPLIVCALTLPSRAKADGAREFIMSCSYGVLAGTLVGAASLAFSDKPGENLNKVARGASIGLYAGILLGLYVVYGVPDQNDDLAMGFVEKESFALASENEWRALPRVAIETRARLHEPPRLQVFPLLGERGLEGAAAQYSIVRF